MLRGEEFKRYVNKLRGKSSVYKMKRAELSDLRAEYGILSRTEEILKAKDAQLLEQLASDLSYLLKYLYYKHFTYIIHEVSSLSTTV